MTHRFIAGTTARLSTLTGKILAVILLLTIGGMTTAAATDYDQLKLKAGRFYQQKEWASASAMYGLMIDRRPEVAESYGRAIVALTMQGAPVDRRVDLVSRSMDSRVPIDSLFSVVERNAFELGHADIYEQFLKEVKAQYPWMTRSVDGYLLRYYTFRSDGPLMIEYSRIMLDKMPHNTSFLEALAKGYLLTGDNAAAMDTYRTILAYAPDNYNALLTLGNYYYLRSRDDKTDIESLDLARHYLAAADSLRPTPYVTRLLAVLNPS